MRNGMSLMNAVRVFRLSSFELAAAVCVTVLLAGCNSSEPVVMVVASTGAPNDVQNPLRNGWEPALRDSRTPPPNINELSAPSNKHGKSAIE